MKGMKNAAPESEEAPSISKVASMVTLECDLSERIQVCGALHDLPLDAVFEICCHLDPYSLLQFSRTSMTIQQLLLSDSARFTWTSSLASVEFPKLKTIRKHPAAHVNFVLGTACSGCGNGCTTDFAFFVRMCYHCVRKHLVWPEGEEGKALIHGLVDGAFDLQAFNPFSSLPYKVKPSYAVGIPDSREYLDLDVKSRIRELREDFERYKEHSSSEERFRSLSEDKEVVITWKQKYYADEEAIRTKLRMDRYDAISTRLEGLGFEKEDVPQHGCNEITLPARLTEHEWYRIKSVVFDVAQKRKLERLQKTRRTAIKNCYISLKTGSGELQHLAVCLPSASYITKRSKIEVFWKPPEASAVEGENLLRCQKVLIEVARQMYRARLIEFLTYTLRKLSELDRGWIGGLSLLKIHDKVIQDVKNVLEPAGSQKSVDEYLCVLRNPLFRFECCHTWLQFDDLSSHCSEDHKDGRYWRGDTGYWTCPRIGPNPILLRSLYAISVALPGLKLTDVTLDRLGKVFQCRDCFWYSKIRGWSTEPRTFSDLVWHVLVKCPDVSAVKRLAEGSEVSDMIQLIEPEELKKLLKDEQADKYFITGRRARSHSF